MIGQGDIVIESEKRNEDLSVDTKTEDRRRPGRVAYDNPALVHMMRRSYLREKLPPPIHENTADEAQVATNDLNPAIGLLTASAIGATLWAIIGCGLYLLFR